MVTPTAPAAPVLADWATRYAAAQKEIPVLVAAPVGTVAEGLAKLGSAATPTMGVLKEALDAAKDVSGALANAPLAGPIFAVLGLVFDQSTVYVENGDSCKNLLERVRGLLLAELPAANSGKFAAWAAEGFIKTVVEAADFCKTFSERRSLVNKVGKFIRGKKIQDELLVLHTELDRAQAYIQTALGLSVHAKLSGVQAVLDTLVEDAKKRADSLADQVMAMKVDLDRVLREQGDDIKEILKSVRAAEYKDAEDKAVASLQAAEAGRARNARDRFADSYAECAALYRALLERAGVRVTDGSRTENALTVARWVEANGDDGIKASDPFRSIARLLLQIASDHRRGLSARQLAESGNIFCFCAPLDAANWKRLKGGRYKHVKLESYGEVLALLASPGNQDDLNLGVLADYTSGNRDPYSERDMVRVRYIRP